MVSLLKKRGNIYYCSNCMLTQPNPPKPNCYFCGNMFSNFSIIKVEKQEEDFVDEIKEKGESYAKKI